MSFGKKGVVAGQSVSQPPAGFGRAQPGVGAMPATRRPVTAASHYDTGMSDAEIAAKREAFLASERAAGNLGPAAVAAAPITLTGARTSQREEYRAPPIKSYSNGKAIAPGKKWLFGEPKGRSLIVAYVFWYFAGLFSLHRFYCGAGESAWYQTGSFFGGLVCMAIWPPLGLLMLGIWVLWLIADIFLIPGMMRRFKSRYDDRSYAQVFD